MHIRPSIPFMSLLAGLALALGSVAPAAAQDESPVPAQVPSVSEREEDGRAAERAAKREQRAAQRDAQAVERATEREQRAALREMAKAERRAERDERKAERRAERAERKASRAQRAEAWAEARQTCQAGLAAVRAETWDDREARKAAWREARAACKAALVASADAADSGGSIDQFYTDAATDESGVVRTDLGLAEPAVAAGQQLGLWHYLIPAGEELAPHTHPGWQLARITAGELEYTVAEGEGVLLRADGGSEPMGPGTYLLAAGDGVIENPELVHYGANRTEEPVTIISATLFEADEPIASVVETEE